MSAPACPPATVCDHCGEEVQGRSMHVRCAQIVEDARMYECDACDRRQHKLHFIAAENASPVYCDTSLCCECNRCDEDCEYREPLSRIDLLAQLAAESRHIR